MVVLILLGFWLIVRKKRREDYRSAEIHSEHSVSDEPQSNTTQTDHQSHRRESHTQRYTDPPSFSAQGKLKYAKTFGDLFIDCANVELQSLEISTVFGDYKEVDGLLFAHSMEMSFAGNPAGQVITIEKIELNVEIDDDRFTMPEPKATEEEAGE